jgi:uncharacterized membrane protein YdjX (TVP38/TMEM64 family)
MVTFARWLFLLVLLASVVALAIIADGRYLALFRDSAALRAWLDIWGSWAPVGIIALQVVQVLLAPIPGNVIGLASGYVFGVARGTLYSLVGTALGSLIAFVLARTYGRPLVERLLPAEMLEWRGLFFFVLLFLLPFLPDDLACFVAGLSPIPIPALMLAALAGRLPGLFVSSWVGANAPGLSSMQWAALIAASAGLALLFLRHEQRLEGWAASLVERFMR